MKTPGNLSLFLRWLIALILAAFSFQCKKEDEPPIAEFEADITTIEQRTEVQFSDLSLNNPTQWNWRFEAGIPQTSTLQNPAITYYHAGDYEVRLTVSNDYGTDIIIRDNYIKVLAPYPEAEFNADTTVCEIDGIISFTDLSTGKPDEWFWTFQGGTPETSTARNPLVIYRYPGTFSVVLTVKNSRSSDTETKDNYITVPYPQTDLTFNNNVFTDIQLTVGEETRTIKSRGTTTYEDVEGFLTGYFAETSGKTADGKIVGIPIYWMGKLNLSGSKMTIDLDLSMEYFYLYITNSGTHDLSPLYVNYGSTDQTVDNILMKADGKKYKVGYYRNNPGLKIRAYWSDDPSSYTQWEKGVDFTILFDKNQDVHLTNYD